MDASKADLEIGSVIQETYRRMDDPATWESVETAV